MSSPLDRPLRPASLVVHGGQRPDPVTGAVMPPVSLSSTYAQSSPGVHSGFEYSRSHNPTRFALERCLAAIEGSTIPEGDGEGEDLTCGGFAFASGLAAIGTVLELLDAGDHMVAMDDLYGGTRRLFSRIRECSQGLEITFADLADPEALAAALTNRTRLIWVETPTNPMMKLADLADLAAFAKDRGIITACDNTFASPMLQRPLSHGIDLVMHSVTKYLGGHSDVVGGMVVTSRPDLAERLRFIQNGVGSVMGPFDSYLTLRGIKTLALRMRQHNFSGTRIAEWLERHPKVRRVIHPGLPSHPQFELVQRQMVMDGRPAGGGMISFDLEGDLDDARRFLEHVGVFTLAESLGGVESLIEHPAIMTHASVPPEARAALGISDTLIRLSVGVEDTQDLIEGLEKGFAAVEAKTPLQAV